jgi:hypothetical protein
MVLEYIGRYKICVDQGFPRSGDMFDKFVGPMSESTRKNLAPHMRRTILQRHNMYVSLRQSSEWGMRALQGTFSRLGDFQKSIWITLARARFLDH